MILGMTRSASTGLVINPISVSGHRLMEGSLRPIQKNWRERFDLNKAPRVSNLFRASLRKKGEELMLDRNSLSRRSYRGIGEPENFQIQEEEMTGICPPPRRPFLKPEEERLAPKLKWPRQIPSVEVPRRRVAAIVDTYAKWMGGECPEIVRETQSWSNLTGAPAGHFVRTWRNNQYGSSVVGTNLIQDDASGEKILD